MTHHVADDDAAPASGHGNEVVPVAADDLPPGIDTTKANIARVYDYWVGGDHNFQADRDLARTIIALDPAIRATMRANRAFLGRAARFLAGQAGVRQFLDIGSGIPTENNVHQVAQDTAPGSRVVYVDHDDVAVAHSRLLLAGNPDATVIQGDLRGHRHHLARCARPRKLPRHLPRLPR